MRRQSFATLWRNFTFFPLIIAALATCTAHTNAQENWQPAKGPLMTRWAKDVSPVKTLPEHPRPQMVRSEWQNLNGLWNYAICPAKEDQPNAADGQILVPYPIESALSGVMKPVGVENRLWYLRSFEVPAKWRENGLRVLLHFGAVDWESTVLVNGQQVGTHRGGYDEFSFDITDALTASGPQQLVVAVWDPTDLGPQARGKQVRRPNGIWYTAVTGIWQTVWLEPVPASSVAQLTLTPDIDAGVVKVKVETRGVPAGLTFSSTALTDDGTAVGTASGQSADLELKIPSAKLWSPDNPYLYSLRVKLQRDGKEIDEVTTYFGMRKISLGKDETGTPRILLNNKPLVQVGPLDQGWWPDGLYTAPTDEALKYDIEVTKQLGFNMARKHVKVEPARWYYWCDKLGLLVWQDMPSGQLPRGSETRTEEAAKQFELELKRMIDQLRSHPSIVMWVPFNEGWGQYDTERITEWTKKYDPTRLVNNASGWTDKHVGDVIDMHNYPGPNVPKLEATRAAVLGEFGGLGLSLAGHTWKDAANWSYRGFKTNEELAAGYVALMRRLHALFGKPGLNAAVYTQITDVEIEVNGLLTYDRAIIKGDAQQIAAANRKLFTPPPPPPVIRTIVPTSKEKGVEWRYTTTKPADNWAAPAFDDTAWQTGPGGFGTRSTPGAVVGTVWNTADIWLRRTFDLPVDRGQSPVRLEEKGTDPLASPVENPALLIHHDEDAEIYLNGELAAKVDGYINNYETVDLAPAARKLLKPGKITIAVHCHQTTGGQIIDVGIVDVVAPETAAAK
jgi:hypothetical protein